MKYILIILLFALVMSQARFQTRQNSITNIIKKGYGEKVSDFLKHLDSTENNMVDEINKIEQDFTDFINASIDKIYNKSLDICEKYWGVEECEKLVEKLKHHLHAN